MALHANAALSLRKRLVLCQRVVEQDWTLTKAAETAVVSVRTARKWVRRYRAEGEAGLGDRPSTPTRQPTRTSEQRVQAIAALRRAAQAGRLRQRRVLLLSCARSPIRPPAPDSPRSHASLPRSRYAPSSRCATAAASTRRCGSTHT